MKEQGKVKSYNGYYGEIINDKNEKYLLKKDEIYEDTTNSINNLLKEGDNVTFKPEKYNDNINSINVARFVRLIKK